MATIHGTTHHDNDTWQWVKGDFRFIDPPPINALPSIDVLPSVDIGRPPYIWPPVGKKFFPSLKGTSNGDHIYGYAGNDKIYGYGGNDYLYGHSGNDIIHAGAGNDYVNGGTGNDTLDGGTGTDTMWGGAGNDTYYVDAYGDQVIEYGGQGIDHVYTSVSTDEVEGLPGNVESLTLTGAAYWGDGNSLNNVIYGNSSPNSLWGYGGNDSLYGLDGHDHLNGGDGNDKLAGGTGADSFYGGNGYDIFDYNALSDSPGFEETSPDMIRDSISDFHGNGAAPGDQIDLSTIDANLELPGNQAFTPSQLSYSNGIFTAEVIGFGIPGSLDLQIHLVGNPPLDIVGPTNDIIL